MINATISRPWCVSTQQKKGTKQEMILLFGALMAIY